MSKSKRIISAALLTVVLVAVIVVDAVQLSGGSVSCSEAKLAPKIKLMTAIYDSNGNFTGCGGSPSNCAVIVLFGKEVMITPDGVHM
jgi:hypothetical protein